MDDPTPSEPDALPEDLLGLIKPELAPGERLIWASRANPRPSRSPSGYEVGALWALGLFLVSAVCFAAFFGAFGGRFATIEAVSGTLGFLLGIASFLVLVGMAGTWISKEAENPIVKKGCYALTDRRAIVWNAKSGSSAIDVSSYHRGTIKNLHRSEYPDGSGDVIFRLGEGLSEWPEVGFQGIAEVRRVEDLVRRFLIVSDSLSVS
jgi:hypothetical protein